MKQHITPSAFSPEEIASIAAQLRKPEGNFGETIANNMNASNKKMILQTLAVLDAQADDHILEIGMGSGLFVKNILNQSSTIKYTGLDYSETMVAMAKQINQAFVKSKQARFVCDNINAISAVENQFNKIFTINTFYFWDDHAQVLQALKRVLKPEGVLIISVRPKHHLEKYPFTKHNFVKWSTSKITTFLQKNGFEEVEVTKIKEPVEKYRDELLQKETHIISCRKAGV